MRLAALACAVVLLADRPAAACTCERPASPCEAFWEVGLVFVGKITRIGPDARGQTSATFEIEEKFKGPVISKTIVLRLGNCGVDLAVGKRYFVYAGNDGGDWFINLCGRTAPLDWAKEDLAYARNRPVRSLGEVTGVVELLDERRKLQVYAGGTVGAQGTAYTAKVDQSGYYKLMVPPGTYKIDVADPDMHVDDKPPPTVQIPDPSACAHAHLVVRYNGRIRGRVVDHTGAPKANMVVRAWGDPKESAPLARTDAKGEYELTGVQAGTYVVAVNDRRDRGPEPDSPFPPTYHPGVATEAAAKPIAMVRSGLVEKVDIKLPKPLAIYRVTGVVKQKGRPMPGGRVSLRTEGKPSYMSVDATTDAAGRFSFREVAGAKVELQACPPDVRYEDRKTACRTVKQTLTRDWSVELEVPP